VFCPTPAGHPCLLQHVVARLLAFGAAFLVAFFDERSVPVAVVLTHFRHACNLWLVIHFLSRHESSTTRILV